MLSTKNRWDNCRKKPNDFVGPFQFSPTAEAGY
jgi:hypothetical protein